MCKYTTGFDFKKKKFKKSSSGTMWSAKAKKIILDWQSYFIFPRIFYVYLHCTVHYPLMDFWPGHFNRFFHALFRAFGMLYDISRSTFFSLWYSSSRYHPDPWIFRKTRVFTIVIIQGVLRIYTTRCDIFRNNENKDYNYKSYACLNKIVFTCFDKIV